MITGKEGSSRYLQHGVTEVTEDYHEDIDNDVLVPVSLKRKWLIKLIDLIARYRSVVMLTIRKVSKVIKMFLKGFQA